MKKFLKITGITIVVILIIAFILAHLLAPPHLESLIKTELTKTLQKDNSANYNVEIADLSFSLFFTRMKVSEISVELIPPDFPDSLETLPRHLIEAKLHDLGLATGGLADFAMKKENIRISSFSLGELQAIVFNNPKGKEPVEKNGNNTSGSVEVNGIDIRSINIEIRDLSDTSITASLENGRLLGDIKIQQEKQGSSNTTLKSLSFSTGNSWYQDTLYVYGMESLIFEDSTISIFVLRMEPLYSKKEFSNQLAWQTDRMDINIDTLIIKGIDINEMINGQIYLIPSAFIKMGTIEAYRDKNVPFDTSRRPPLPVKLLQTAPIKIQIGEVGIENLDIFYSEFPEDGEQAGTVPFSKLSGNITNISNIEQNINKDSIMRISARATTVGNATIEAKFRYNLSDINGGFSAEGQLNRFDFEDLNPIIYPLAGIKTDKGYHEKSSFSFSGNDFSSSGILEMEYYDLGVVLEPSKSKFRRQTVNWITSNFVYHPSNPPGEGFRSGPIDFDRDPTRFVFHYWWNSYLSGIKSSALR